MPPLRRNVIVIDELAEITDTTDMDKPHKKLAPAVVGKLATIARLGRAVGFNLVIGVQCGDANIVPGQIKSNISGRVCGVADDTLSRIILGNGDADTLITKHGRGLFLTGRRDVPGLSAHGSAPPQGYERPEQQARR